MMTMNINKQLLAALAVGLLILVGGILFLFTLESRRGKLPVNIAAFPDSAVINIDDKRFSTGRQYLTPGEHSITASNEGYETLEQTVVVETDGQYIGLILVPESDEAKQQSAEQALERENIGGTIASQRGQLLRERYPLINDLPHFDIAGPYRIEYRFDEDNHDHIYIYINYSVPEGRIAALDWIRSQDYDVEDYDIRFADFDNPIKPRGEQ